MQKTIYRIVATQAHVSKFSLCQLPLPIFSRCLCAALLMALSFFTTAAELAVQITNIKDANSTIHIYVFTQAEGFPKEDNAAVHILQAGPHGTDVKMKIKVPQADEYALMAFQDTDDDGKMSRFLGMIPQEPYALSRDPQTFGKPKFNDSAVTQQDGTIVLILH